ncbi:MAG: hypothetical protein E6612_10615, partial [Paeniclostridium sordellii]|nr:hypothetical protein [Paeniclostridium sordellii]
MSKSLEISYSFGYVFDKSKLIVMCPVGENTMSEEEYEMEVEVAFLEDGIEKAFEEADINEANDIIKPLETFLMKPNKVIPFVTSIKDGETKQNLDKLLEDFDEEYEIKKSYIKKGYEICDIYDVFQNVIKYIPKENIENLNILKIEENKFNFNLFLEETIKNLEEEVDSNCIVLKMRKSNLTDRLFVKESTEIDLSNLKEQSILDVLKTDSMYVLFGLESDSQSREIMCANKEVITDINVDMGDLDVSQTKDFGYIIEKNDTEICFKIANFNWEAANNQQIAQVVDYSGKFKLMM